MLKDLHLVGGSLQADMTVVSRDDTARGLFHGASRTIPELKQVAWVNPCVCPSDVIAWLEGGAKSGRDYLLGN